MNSSFTKLQNEASENKMDKTQNEYKSPENIAASDPISQMFSKYLKIFLE